MHLIYSALREITELPVNNDHIAIEKQLRYEAYLTVCRKYRREIAAIQKYFPQWEPRFDIEDFTT